MIIFLYLKKSYESLYINGWYLIHSVDNNKLNSYYDNDIYPKFISEISNCLCELLVDNFSTKKIINKLIEFLDYMSNNGYCNDDNDIIKK
jgi:hypothetical protein